MIDAAELVDNDFLRQFELKVDDKLAKIEYSLQERKIFLTKLVIPEEIHSTEFEEDFLKLVLQNIQERNLSDQSIQKQYQDPQCFESKKGDRLFYLALQ